jgi:hypothetical protein
MSRGKNGIIVLPIKVIVNGTGIYYGKFSLCHYLAFENPTPARMDSIRSFVPRHI